MADALLSVRNRETLTRLAHIAEGREGNHEALITGQGEEALPEQVDGEDGEAVDASASGSESPSTR